LYEIVGIDCVDTAATTSSRSTIVSIVVAFEMTREMVEADFSFWICYVSALPRCNLKTCNVNTQKIRVNNVIYVFWSDIVSTDSKTTHLRCDVCSFQQWRGKLVSYSTWRNVIFPRFRNRYSSINTHDAVSQGFTVWTDM
jgi:hypothetical protein